MAQVQPAQISRIKSGARGTTPEVLVRIARALQISPVRVFRAAGLLPPEPDQNETVEDVLEIMSGLPGDEQVGTLEFVKMRARIAEEKGEYKTQKPH